MTSALLDFSKPHVLRNEEEYDAAVTEIDALLDAGALSAEEADRLEFLTLLVEAYDEAHHPMGETSTPQSVVAFLLEQNGMSRADLNALLGGKSRVSEFFSGQRSLSLGQIQRLRERFGVSADALLPRRAPAAAGTSAQRAAGGRGHAGRMVRERAGGESAVRRRGHGAKCTGEKHGAKPTQRGRRGRKRS
jgi:HTH-type transcriptional regulator/antitoxin HigA